MVEILRISSFYGLFLPPFSYSRRIYIRLRYEKRRFFLKSAYPLIEYQGAVSNFTFKTAPFLCFLYNIFYLTKYFKGFIMYLYTYNILNGGIPNEHNYRRLWQGRYRPGKPAQ